jgi:lipopolysaccharide transport system permease protein
LVSPFDVFLPLKAHHSLLWEMTKRDIATKYRGSYLGILWSVLMPLAMLCIYSYVFGWVFKSRWGNAHTNVLEFPIVLFAGLIVFNLLAECINRAPSLVTSSPNLVKKVVFPLIILPWMALLTASINALISMTLLLIGEWLVMGNVPLTALLFPVALIPVGLVALGLSWILASIGVFVRDLAQIVTLLTTALLFLTPIFYPPHSTPSALSGFMAWNPLSSQVQAMREITLWGTLPDPLSFVIATLVGWCIAWLGLIWFSKTYEGFADVL